MWNSFDIMKLTTPNHLNCKWLNHLFVAPIKSEQCFAMSCLVMGLGVVLFSSGKPKSEGLNTTTTTNNHGKQKDGVVRLSR